jgi:hypothetical protein
VGKSGLGDFFAGDGGGAWLWLGIFVDLGKNADWKHSFLTVVAGLNNQRGGENLLFLKFKSCFWEYSESEGSFGGLFGLSIRLLIFSGLISTKKGGFRIHDLISIICIIIFGNF